MRVILKFLFRLLFGQSKNKDDDLTITYHQCHNIECSAAVNVEQSFCDSCQGKITCPDKYRIVTCAHCNSVIAVEDGSGYRFTKGCRNCNFGLIKKEVLDV